MKKGVRRGVRAMPLLLVAIVALAVAPDALARQSSGSTSSNLGRVRPLSAGAWTRIADPKLDGGLVHITYFLEPTARRYDVTITVLSGGTKVLTLFQGLESGSDRAHHHYWDGRDKQGNFVDPGTYTVDVTATNGGASWSLDPSVDIVRLGVRRIGAVSSDPNTANEFQTVYFMKDGKYNFYATPTVAELQSRAPPGDVSDLDLNDGSPRPLPDVWTKTDEPVLEPDGSGGKQYDLHHHNYPLCYLSGAQPEFSVIFGDNCTTSSGQRHDCNYPVAGYEIRAVASDEAGDWTSTLTDLHPGDTIDFVGPALTTASTRTTRHVDWRWQYRKTGATEWTEIPGHEISTHRIYTILQPPSWAPGASGVQYSGPWVEVAEYFYQWQKAIGITPTTSSEAVEVFIKGFFGQNSNIPTAIEGVEYDCPANGGDGGATHYYVWGQYVNLSRLLNNHDLGIYVNCSDCASLTSTMMGMLGVQNTQMVYLGSMTLRAIWGIGCAAYTTDIWNNGGGSGHGFSYHHVVTRDGAITIDDDCLCVDEDGDPNNTPGIPGWNNDRDWSNYESLLAYGTISKTLDILPKLK